MVTKFCMACNTIHVVKKDVTICPTCGEVLQEDI